MNRRIYAACIAVAPLLLGGCTVFHKLGFGHPRPVEQASVANPTEVPSLTAAGRKQLDSGNLGLAIEAFQQALGRGEPPAPALNGLGVAYARLGRADMADQLFRQAMAEDPANEKYAANLALLAQSQQAIDAAAAAAVRTAEAPAPAAPSAPAAAQPLAVAVPQIEGRLVQVAPREFTIRTVRPQPAPARVAWSVPAGFRPIVRIVLRPATHAPTPAPAADKAPAAKEELR